MSFLLPGFQQVAGMEMVALNTRDLTKLLGSGEQTDVPAVFTFL